MGFVTGEAMDTFGPGIEVGFGGFLVHAAGETYDHVRLPKITLQRSASCGQLVTTSSSMLQTYRIRAAWSSRTSRLGESWGESIEHYSSGTEASYIQDFQFRIAIYFLQFHPIFFWIWLLAWKPLLQNWDKHVKAGFLAAGGMWVNVDRILWGITLHSELAFNKNNCTNLTSKLSCFRNFNLSLFQV